MKWLVQIIELYEGLPGMYVKSTLGYYVEGNLFILVWIKIC